MESPFEAIERLLNVPDGMTAAEARRKRDHADDVLEAYERMDSSQVTDAERDAWVDLERIWEAISDHLRRKEATE